MMADVSDALAQLKTILTGSYDPSPQDALVTVYHYPADYSSLASAIRADPVILPIAIVAQVVNQRFNYRPISHSGSIHSWQAEIVIPIDEGPWDTLSDSGPIEQKQQDYLNAMHTLLINNRSLNSTALSLGEGDNQPLFHYRIGGLGIDTQTFWGIWFGVQVNQIVGA